MKIAKRVLALVVTVLMIVSTCAIAASAAESLQSLINAAGDSLVMTRSYTESIVIDKDFTLDLGGYAIIGEPGKVAIDITNGATVTIKNGHVKSMFADVSSAKMIQTVISSSPSAIRVNSNASLEVEGVRVLGAMTRVPTTQKYYVPTGSAIEANNANVTLTKTSLYGRYGVNNKNGAKVLINDAVVIGAMRGIRNGATIAEGTQTDSAAEHINGIFNGSKKLSAREIGLINSLLGDRATVYTRPVNSDAVVTITEGNDVAVVTASVDASNVWKNNTSTDCSYKYVPEYAVLANGKLVKMTSEDGVNYTANVPAAIAADGVQVKYRTWAVLQPDLAKYAGNARAYINRLYDMVLDKMDYDMLKGIFNYYVDMVCDVWQAVVEIPSAVRDNLGQAAMDAIMTNASYLNLRQAMFNLGGAVMVNGNQGWTDQDEDGNNIERSKYYIGYGQRKQFTADPEVIKDAYAPLDVICQMVDKFDAKYGTLRDDSVWGEIAATLYKKAFADGGLIDMAFDAKDALDNLVAALEDETVAELIEMANLQDKAALVSKLADLADEAVAVYDRVMASSTVKSVLQKVENNQDLIPVYVDKAVYVFHNMDEYVTPEKFVSGNNLMAWSTDADAEIVTVEAEVEVNVTVSGIGTVSYAGGSTTASATATHNGTITLTASCPADQEFLYWANNADNIISTEPSLTLVTGVNRDLTAVFGPIDTPTVTFASTLGNVVGSANYSAGNTTVLAGDDIEIPGFAFDAWPGQDGATVDVSALVPETAYYAGGASAFAVPGSRYSNTGHVLAYRPTSASIILIPSFSADTDCTVTYVDNGEETTAEVKLGSTVTYTATGDNFAYWMDDSGKIVSVEKTYSHQVVRSATFTAVYDAEPVDYAVNIVWRSYDAGTNKDTFYAERSVKSGLKVLSAGIVVGPADLDDKDLDVNSSNPAIKKGTSRNTLNNATYSVTLSRDTFNYAVKVRPYVEIAGIGVVYGGVETRN